MKSPPKDENQWLDELSPQEFEEYEHRYQWVGHDARPEQLTPLGDWKTWLYLAGLDADQMSAAIAKGGPAAEEAFSKTLAGLQSIKDPLKRDQAAVDLFGTQYEDLGPKMLTSLQQGTKGMKGVEGSTKRAGDAMSDNLGSKIAGVSRKLNTMVSGQFGAGMGEIVAGAGEAGMAVGGIVIGASAAAPWIGKVTVGLRGLAASNVTVGATATGASVGMTRMAVAGRVLRGVMLTMVLPVAAVVGLGAAFVLAYNKSERFRAGVDKLDTALIGNKNTAEITKNGWKGLGNVASDNSGISILWAKDLGKVETGMRQNKEAATPFNRAMLDLGQRMRDNKGISGGLSGIWRSMRTTMTDNKGVSDLWARGTGNLTSKLADNKGASGALRGAWAGLKQRAMDNKGASAAWAGGLEGLRKRISDNKGISSAWSGGLVGLRKRLTDNKGASGALGGALSGLKKSLTDNKGASGALKTALGSLKEKAVGAGAGFVTLRNQGLNKLGELKNKGIALAGNLGTGAVNRFEEMKSGSRGRFQQLAANGISKLGELGKRGGENIRSFVKGGLDKYTEMRKGGATRFEALRGAVVGSLSEAKTRGISRIHELGTEAKASWGRQSENARDRYSNIRNTIGDKLREGKTWGVNRIHELGTEAKASWSRQSENANDRYSKIRDTIGDKLREGRNWGTDRIKELGGNLRDAFGRQLEATGAFGDKFKDILGDKFGGAVNLARKWLGSLMFAAGYVLDAIGAGELSGDAKSLGENLQTPKKFAKGGVVDQYARGGMGTSGAEPRVHMWNEQQGGEAFIAEKRPASEQLPYLQTAAGWHDYAVVPANPAKFGVSAGFAEGGVYPTRAFAGGGIGGMYNAVKEKFGIEGFNRHGGYLTGAAATDSLDFMVTTPGTRAEGSQKELGDNIAAFTAPPSAVNTVWYGMGNFGAGWTSNMNTKGVGNANTLGHYDHVHAQAHPSSFRGAQGTFSGGSGGGGPSGIMDALGNAWNSVTDFMGSTFKPPGLPDIGLGMIGSGFEGFAGTLLGKTKDWLADKASSMMGGVGGVISKLGSADKNKVAAWMASNAEGRGMPGRLPVMTALQESGMTNLSGGDRDSLGYFQQRPSQGWGTEAQITDPEYSLGKFLDAASQYKGQYSNSAGGLNDWAQAVQRSGFPDAYAKHWGTAGSMIEAGQQNKNLRTMQYGRGGVIPGQAGKEVMIQAHAGERVLPREVVASFDRLANSVTLWSKKQAGTSTMEIDGGGGAMGSTIERQTKKMEAELKRQTKVMQQQAKEQVKATVNAVFAAQMSDLGQDILDRVLSQGLEAGSEYVAGAR